MAFTARLKPEIHNGKQSKDLHRSCSMTACQETSSRSKCCRERECGRGSKNQVCTLRTRQAPSRTGSQWTVIFLRFKSMPSFPSMVIHKIIMSRRLPDTERAQTLMFSVWIEWRKNCALSCFPCLIWQVSRSPERPLWPYQQTLTSNTAYFYFFLNTYA